MLVKMLRDEKVSVHGYSDPEFWEAGSLHEVSDALGGSLIRGQSAILLQKASVDRDLPLFEPVPKLGKKRPKRSYNPVTDAK